MPEWEQIISQHAGEVWQTASRLVPPDRAARCFIDSFLRARGEAHRDSVSDWSMLLQRITSTQSLASLRESPPEEPQTLADHLRLGLITISDQQALLYCLRYVSALGFSEISMELSLPLENIGPSINEACTLLGRYLVQHAPTPEAHSQFAHQPADDLLETATAQLRDMAVPEPPVDLTQQTLDAFAAAGPEPSYEKPLQRELWPIVASGLAAMLIILFVAGYLYSKRKRPPAILFDKVVAAVQEIDTVSYDVAQTLRLADGRIRKIDATVTVAPDGKMREVSDPPDQVVVWDYQQKKALTLETTKKRATLRDIADMESPPFDALAFLQSLDPNAVKPDVLTALHGRKVQGFRAEEAQLTILADVETRLPIMLERHGKDGDTILLSDFKWSPTVDPAELALEAPSDYESVAIKVNLKPATEQDLIKALDIAAQLNAGRFPEQFDRQSMGVLLDALRKTLPTDKSAPGYRQAQEDFESKLLQLGRGWMYISETDNGDQWHYAGGGVFFGSDKPVLWYRPAGSKTYRVIDGQLTTRSANPDRLPNVPATPIARPTTQRSTIPQ